MGLHRARRVGASDEVFLVTDVDAHLGQRRIVERAEGIEILRIDFGGTVAAHQLVLEEDADFGHHGRAVGAAGGGYLDGGDEVLLAVGTQHADGQLRTGQDDGFRQILEHEAQGTGRVGHGVGAVQDDETVVVVVVAADDFHNLGPEFRLHVRRVDGWVELVGGDVAVEAFQFGHMLEQLVEVEALQSTCFGILNHADGTAGINQ